MISWLWYHYHVQWFYMTMISFVYFNEMTPLWLYIWYHSHVKKYHMTVIQMYVLYEIYLWYHVSSLMISCVHDITCTWHHLYYVHYQATACHATLQTLSQQMTPTQWSKIKAVQHLCSSQQHTAMHYMDSTSTLVTNVFRTQQASETYVKHVKRTVSCVADSAPILA